MKMGGEGKGASRGTGDKRRKRRTGKMKEEKGSRARKGATASPSERTINNRGVSNKLKHLLISRSRETPIARGPWSLS